MSEIQFEIVGKDEFVFTPRWFRIDARIYEDHFAAHNNYRCQARDHLKKYETIDCWYISGRCGDVVFLEIQFDEKHYFVPHYNSSINCEWFNDDDECDSQELDWFLDRLPKNLKRMKNNIKVRILETLGLLGDTNWL